MSSINKAAFRTIGLFALIASAVFLVVNVSELSKITTIQRLIYLVTSLAVDCIGIYGGFQLAKLRKVGHQLLTIWLLCQILMIILVVLVLATDLSVDGPSQYKIPSPIPTPLLIVYYSISFIAIIYLLASRTSKELLVDDNPRHLRIVLILLSLLTPGLARALVSNLAIGMALFYLYRLSMLLTAYSISEPEYLRWVQQFLYYLVMWRIFSAIDWNAVKNFERSARIKNDIPPDLTLEQVNGG